MKKTFLILFSFLFLAGVRARISSCVITLQSAHMSVLVTKHDKHSITVPEHVRSRMMEVVEGDTLYVTENRSTHNAELELFIPEDTELTIDLFGTAQVTVNKISVPVSATMAGTSTLCLHDGMCPELKLAMQGACTVVGPELMVGEADIAAHGENDIVLQHVREFARCDIGGGTHMVSGHTVMCSASRARRAPLSVVAAYRAAGVAIDDRLSFYEHAAVEPEWHRQSEYSAFPGNPLHSSDQSVRTAHIMMTHDFLQTGSATRICRAIREIPHVLAVEREVLGAMLCRRLMLCTLEKPIGTGAISPNSLYHAGGAPEREQANVEYIWEHMWKGTYSLIERGVCGYFGLFGHFFEHAIRHIKRCRELSPESDWRELFAKVYKNTDAFVMHGHRAWQEGSAT